MVLDDGKSEQKVRIGIKLIVETRQKRFAFLKERKHYFAWDIFDMPGIVLEVITHKLNVDTKFKLVK